MTRSIPQRPLYPSVSKPIYTKTPTYTEPPTYKEPTYYKPTIIETPPSTVIKGGLRDLSGSASPRPYLGGGFTKWQRDNPVADIAYLSKGLGGSGKATKKSKRKSKDPFGGSPF
jgi:hypothetical protein